MSCCDCENSARVGERKGEGGKEKRQVKLPFHGFMSVNERNRVLALRNGNDWSGGRATASYVQGTGDRGQKDRVPETSGCVERVQETLSS